MNVLLAAQVITCWEHNVIQPVLSTISQIKDQPNADNALPVVKLVKHSILALNVV